MKSNSVFLTVLIAASVAQAELKSQDVASVQEGKKFIHHLISDANASRPGVMIAPEWWGITGRDREIARDLAAKGYAVMIVDFYGNGASTLDPNKAGQWMSSVQNDKFNFDKRFQVALSFFRTQPGVDGANVATLGFGLGGGVAVQQARESSDVKAVVDFFGGLNPTGYAEADKITKLRIEKMSKPRKIAPEILVLVGERDAYVSDDQIKRFTKEMIRNEARFKVEILPNAYHAFTRPGVEILAGKSKDKLFMRYDAKAEKEAWQKAYAFLEKKLAPARIPASVTPAPKGR